MEYDFMEHLEYLVKTYLFFIVKFR